MYHNVSLSYCKDLTVLKTCQCQFSYSVVLLTLSVWLLLPSGINHLSFIIDNYFSFFFKKTKNTRKGGYFFKKTYSIFVPLKISVK
jgi:hypothetical protein